MADREKAIRILEGNYKDFVLRHNGELLTVNELITLLKEQEPVKVEKEYSKGNLSWWYVCGSCHASINLNDKYCNECGRQVRWNDVRRTEGT